MKIVYSPRFVKLYNKLNNSIKLKAEKKEEIFRKNPFDSRLETHKLSGWLDGLWSFSVDYDCRIIFELKNEKMVIFHAIGGHSIYK